MSSRKSNSQNNKRLLKNSIILYARMTLSLIITLYTSRLVLQSLGIEDFGIFSVVGGTVTIMSFLSGAMASANQRFFSYTLGDCGKSSIELKNIFNTSLNIHIIIVLIGGVVSLTFGLYLVGSVLNVEPDKQEAAKFIFYCAVFSFCCSVIQVPYNALIIAYEKMTVFAALGIVDVVLKFLVAISLQFLATGKLETYGFLLCISSFLVLILNIAYVRTRFACSKYSFYWDQKLFNTLISYTGWSLFGNLSSVMSVQGINIILNVFFGVTVNASRAIAFQVQMAVTGLISSLMTAINPQIVKSYANGDLSYMQHLVFKGTKYSFILMFLISLPLMLQIDYILDLWLGVVPEYANIFCQLILVDSLIVILSSGLMTAFQATGKIKAYQVIVGGILLLNIPISYAFLSFGAAPYIVAWVAITLSLLAFGARIVLLTRVMSFDVISFFKLVILKVISIVVVAGLPSIIVNSLELTTNLKFFVVVLSSILFIAITVYFLALDGDERNFLKKIVATSIDKLTTNRV